MRLIVARCSARYDGRLGATLAPGVRLVVVKADGSVAIHSDSGYRPLNWMTPPNTVTELPGDDGAELVWEVTNPKGELLRITFDEIISDTTVEVDVESGLVLDGVEREVQELLAENPQHIEAGLRLVEREFRTDLGPVDLLCRDLEGRAVAVEIKRIGEIDGVEQLSRYLERLDRDPLLSPIRGIFAATEVKPQARVLAESRGIYCAEVDIARLRAEEERHPRLF
jgi:endonuclease